MTPLIYVLNGFIGALASFLADVAKGSKRLGDVKSDKTAAMLLLGALLGYIYYNLVARFSLPDSVIAIAVGYANINALDAIITFLQRKAEA